MAADAAAAVCTEVLKELVGEVDAAAYAVVIIAPLVNFRRHAWTFGAPPLGVDDDRLLAAWAETCVVLAEALGVGGQQTGTTRRRPAKRAPL